MYSGMEPGTRLLTHRDCLDGMGAALLFLMEGATEADIHYTTPDGGSVDDAVIRLLRDGTGPIHVVDVCPGAWVLDRLLSDPRSVVCDHHVSSAPRMEGRDGCLNLQDRCGALVYAEYLGRPCERDLRSTFRGIDAYDLGRREDEYWNSGVFLADLLSSNHFGGGQTGLVMMLSCLGDEVFGDVDAATAVDTVRRIRAAYSKEAASSAWRVRFPLPSDDGWAVSCWAAVAVAPRWWRNDVGAALLALDGIDLAVVVDITAGVASLRSREGGPDCARIAEGYGGGGHARASGFPVRRSDFLKAIIE